MGGDGTSLDAVDFLGEMPTGDGEGRQPVRRAVLRIDARPHRRRARGAGRRRPAACARRFDQLSAYFHGVSSRSSRSRWPPPAPTSSCGSGSSCAKIPYGATATYGEVAGQLGLTGHGAHRAVGTANGRNPIPIVVPCHRVMGANGSLTGYGGGLQRKQKLLELEQDAFSEPAADQPSGRCAVPPRAAPNPAGRNTSPAVKTTIGASNEVRRLCHPRRAPSQGRLSAATTAGRAQWASTCSNGEAPAPTPTDGPSNRPGRAALVETC